MALRPREVRFYKDRCSIYRKNEARAANGEVTYSLLAANVVCKHFTRPNYDTAATSGGITEAKENNVFTSDVLHMDPAQDIAAEDFVLMTTSPATPSKLTWFRVAGEPETRLGISNRSAVYMEPAGKPKRIV